VRNVATSMVLRHGVYRDISDMTHNALLNVFHLSSL
jgi:hypothetical protein